MSKSDRKETLKVVPMLEVNAADIASQFRRMADEIDAGKHGHIESMVACAEIDGVIRIYGWGNIDGMRGIAMFKLGCSKLAHETLKLTGSISD